MNRRKRQRLKYYRYCVKQARQLMRREVLKYKLWHGVVKMFDLTNEERALVVKEGGKQ
ncbi:MAG: hypothetical protein U0O09_07360 [Phascolarctobacterium sp.]|jgi:hypothetical protein|uniref:hypothetical protein n=1 Tax=uncultured Phascolarctobacterium sp. TaxID=512296 RepID=UPI0020499508|nr:hypothetical protein [uncultured Phascolarctobacterium sp.]MEE0328827.1 hypothetical protein [Phascolarctobacterium succinatutens]DAU60594.1 MAG TPA: hypothetical protein [Caudoviricetes sp.]